MVHGFIILIVFFSAPLRELVNLEELLKVLYKSLAEFSCRKGSKKNPFIVTRVLRMLNGPIFFFL